ncbi:MAG: hypothetical protein HUK40_14125 [Desulfobacter sp.]|nr:hypothetical protein [Desulfobacter sp.]WDP87726.1 MAG: hypothetical protein HUN05_23465 [Desulfobacter sp.]
MNTSMPEFTEKEMLKEFKNAAQYVDDILYGRKTIAQVTKISKEEIEDTFVKAQNALSLEDYKKAALLFQAILVVNNKDMRALLGLAGALEGKKDFALAATAYVAVMMANFQDPVAPFRAGHCLMNMGKKQEAVKMFQLAQDCDEKRCSSEKRKYIQKAKNILKALS